MFDVDRMFQGTPMKVIYGQCASCEKTAEYSVDDVKKVGMVACKYCRSKSVWRVYTNAELDQMRKGERVD